MKFGEFFYYGGSADVLMKTRNLLMRSRDCIWPPTLQSSSPGTPACPWGPCSIRWTFPKQLWEEMLRTWGTNVMVWAEVNSYRRPAKGCRNGSRRTSRRCGTRRSGLSAHLTTAFWTILCGAFLSYRSMQSLTTKSRTYSWRWRCWWGP